MENADYKSWKKAASKSSLYRSFVDEKIADGEEASGHIGNMYTASIFMSLISLLSIANEKSQEIAGNKIGFLSYGSGSKSKIFEGIINENWKAKIAKIDVFNKIANRKVIDFTTYEKLHNSAIKDPIITEKMFSLKSIDNRENKIGFRHYN